MEPTITTIGFEPKSDFLGVLKEKLTHLSEASPDNSSLSVQIVKRPRVYEVSVISRSANGHMKAESHNPILFRALTRSLEKMHEQISEWHRRRFAEEVQPSEFVALEIPPSRQHKPSVLIVDDDPMSTQFLDFCLRKNGCTTKYVSNGYSAVREITSEKYDLVFLDWNMPDMNGGETLLSAQNLIAYDRSLHHKMSEMRMPVITYSGRQKKDIELPDCEHFRFIDHWDKSTPFQQLLHQASDVLFRFKTPET